MCSRRYLNSTHFVMGLTLMISQIVLKIPITWLKVMIVSTMKAPAMSVWLYLRKMLGRRYLRLIIYLFILFC